MHRYHEKDADEFARKSGEKQEKRQLGRFDHPVQIDAHSDPEEKEHTKKAVSDRPAGLLRLRTDLPGCIKHRAHQYTGDDGTHHQPQISIFGKPSKQKEDEDQEHHEIGDFGVRPAGEGEEQEASRCPGHGEEEGDVEDDGQDSVGIAAAKAAFFADPDRDEGDEEYFDHIIEHPGTDDVVPHFGLEKIKFIEDGDDHRLGRGHPRHPDHKRQYPAVSEPEHGNRTEEKRYESIEHGGQDNLAALMPHRLHIDLRSDEKEEEQYPQIGQCREDFPVNSPGQRHPPRRVVHPHGDKEGGEDSRDFEPLQHPGQQVAQSEQYRQQQQKRT